MSSYNRNFVGRHDGNARTHSFVTSPELVTAFAYAGSLDYNPQKDYLTSSNGTPFRFDAPSAEELPEAFAVGKDTYQAPPEDPSSVEVIVDPSSDRLQLLKPFEAWQTGNADHMRILIKVKGKCTTDHISPAGPWYKYRGHLENISNNMLTAAENAFLPSNGRGLAISTIDDSVESVPAVAKMYRDQGIKWCIIGDSNYGEGSSREHAALEPRFLGGIAVIAKGFARIHETNLKKQGMLPLTFADPKAYDRINSTDRISIVGVESIAPQEQLTMKVEPESGEVWETRLNHSYHAGQIPWLKHGSALNYIRSCKG